MPVLMDMPPQSPIEEVTDVWHGIPILDPYRWLEDQESARTREWIARQRLYARSYLASIAGRTELRERIRSLLDVETHDSLQKIGDRYFFRKRLPGQEQPCICTRAGLDGQDEILIDPARRGTGPYTAVRLLEVSPDCRLLLYEIKQGGERSGCFELFDLEKRTTLPDKLPHGYLRGFAFSHDCESFYYVHEPLDSIGSRCSFAYKHCLGTEFSGDVLIFSLGGDTRVRLHIISGRNRLGFLVIRFPEKTSADFHLWTIGNSGPPEAVITNAEYKFGPLLLGTDRVLAITDHEAPNLKIVEVLRVDACSWKFQDIIPEIDSPIHNWTVIGNHIFVSYFQNLETRIEVFDLSGNSRGQVPIEDTDTVRFLSNSENNKELLFERESFTKPVEICSSSVPDFKITVWSRRRLPFRASDFAHELTWYRSKDGTKVPIFLVGRHDVLNAKAAPTIMTAYGGYGVSVTPQFSVFVSSLMERGCLFALPNIRGGSEFGLEWHESAKRRKRQVAIGDFLAAAEWLVESRRTDAQRLAIFGGSNSGLLVGAAMTQRPGLFRAVLCLVPILDMLRYHLFDNGHIWKDEFGTADDPDDFAALYRYSPYHNVRKGVAYPATMICSGDADQTCNPLHARKMVARLQAANSSSSPILLDYSMHRGHSPVLPLSERIEALTDRVAFICDQLGLIP